VDYRTLNWEVAGSTLTWSTVSNFEQVAKQLCLQANPTSYPLHFPHSAGLIWLKPCRSVEHRPQTTPLHLAPSCAATSIFLQLYLKPIVHISFSSSLLQMVFCCSLPLWSCGAHCNTCFTVLSLAPLQHVQNAAARLIFELTPRDHITPSLLQQLHWLPVRWRIEYKLCCIMHSVHTGRRLAYLRNTVQLGHRPLLSI